MKQKIFITGATGFIGTYLIRKINIKEYDITCLVRKFSDKSEFRKCKQIIGDIKDINSFSDHLKGIGIVIHLAASLGTTDKKIIRETNLTGTKNLIEASIKNKVKHFIQLSSTVAYVKTKGYYGITKLEADNLLKNSNLNYTILIPGFVYGRESRFLNKILQLQKLPIVPLIGNCKIQTIFIEDLIDAILSTINNKNTYNKSYFTLSEEKIYLKNIYKEIQKKLDIKKMIIPIPRFLALFILHFINIFSNKIKFAKEGINQFYQDYNFDITSAKNDLKFNPLSFSEGLKKIPISK